eukprot:51515-Eustigmatos_ZCMA.PRE.1
MKGTKLCSALYPVVSLTRSFPEGRRRAHVIGTGYCYESGLFGACRAQFTQSAAFAAVPARVCGTAKADNARRLLQNCQVRLTCCCWPGRRSGGGCAYGAAYGPCCLS